MTHHTLSMGDLLLILKQEYMSMIRDSIDARLRRKHIFHESCMDVIHQSNQDLPCEACSILLTMELDAGHFQTLLDTILQLVWPQNQIHPTLLCYLTLPSMIDLHIESASHNSPPIVFLFSDGKYLQWCFIFFWISVKGEFRNTYLEFQF